MRLLGNDALLSKHGLPLHNRTIKTHAKQFNALDIYQTLLFDSDKVDTTYNVDIQTYKKRFSVRRRL